MRKYEAKNLQTETALKNAFMTLYSQNHLSQLKVEDICTAAGINRSTFYRHYSGISDLLHTIETELIQGVVKATESSGHPENMAYFSRSMLNLMVFFQENSYSVRPLLANSNSYFYQQYKARIRQGILETCKFLTISSLPNMDYIAHYAAGGAIDIILYWLEKQDKTPEAMALFFIEQLKHMVTQPK